MKQDYQKMQQQILPGREKQDEIWGLIERKIEKRRRKYNYWQTVRMAACITAIIFICACCLPQTGIADNIKGFLERYFDKPASMEQDTVKSVYEDSDGHVKMQVTKMLSDGACAYLDICYKALDETGKRWLSEEEMGVEAIQFLYKGEIVGKTVGCSAGLEEYKELATKQARYFTFKYKDYSGNFNLNKVERILSYPMCEEKREGRIKVSSNMETFAYRLEGDGSPSRFYQAEYLLVSKLSYGIFGKNQGVYANINDKFGSGGYMMEEFLSSPDSDIPDVTFFMKDGTKRKSEDMAAFSPALNVSGYDLTVAAGYFYDETDGSWEKHMAINPEELAGVEIKGVYYKLVPEE